MEEKKRKKEKESKYVLKENGKVLYEKTEEAEVLFQKCF